MDQRAKSIIKMEALGSDMVSNQKPNAPVPAVKKSGKKAGGINIDLFQNKVFAHNLDRPAEEGLHQNVASGGAVEEPIAEMNEWDPNHPMWESLDNEQKHIGYSVPVVYCALFVGVIIVMVLLGVVVQDPRRKAILGFQKEAMDRLDNSSIQHSTRKQTLSTAVGNLSGLPQETLNDNLTLSNEDSAITV